MRVMEKDPNGVAAAIVVIVNAAAAAVGLNADSETVTAVAQFGAALLSLAGVLAARRKAWAPDTVRALTPRTVGDAGVLPKKPPVP